MAFGSLSWVLGFSGTYLVAVGGLLIVLGCCCVLWSLCLFGLVLFLVVLVVWFGFAFDWLVVGCV